jgi:hypothetical protein
VLVDCDLFSRCELWAAAAPTVFRTGRAARKARGLSKVSDR